MTQEEKLSNIYELSIESAKAQSEQMLAECRAASEAEFASLKCEKEADTARWLGTEAAALRRQLRRELSDRQSEIRRKTAARQREVRELIFANAAKKLESFRQTSEYKAWLFQKVKEAAAFAAGDEVQIYVDPDDAAYTDEIKEVCGILPTLSKVRFGGGIRAVIREKRILIDNSFDTLMQEAEDTYMVNEFN